MQPSPLPAPQPIDHATILIVDDDPALARSIARIVSRGGWTSHCVNSVDAACAYLRGHEVDAVVSDVRMPGATGLDLLARLRDNDGNLPVVLLSGARNMADMARAIELGASRFLAKPVNSVELRSTLREIIAKRRAAEVVRSRLARLAEEDQARRVAEQSAHTRFAEAVAAVDVHFQPIVSWSERRVVGYEALVRCSIPDLRSPLALLDLARRVDGMHELGDRIQQRALGRFCVEPTEADLYLNLAPEDLHDDRLLDPATQLAKVAHRVILEVSEQARADTQAKERLDAIRSLGFRLAVDDVGAGYAGLNSIAQLEPDVIKLDMALVRDVHLHPIKQRLVRAMVAVARESAVEVIAEGVECDSERAALSDLGCELVQGYFIARPEPRFARPFD